MVCWEFGLGVWVSGSGDVVDDLSGLQFFCAVEGSGSVSGDVVDDLFGL